MFITEFEQFEEKQRHVRKTQRPWLECRKIKSKDMQFSSLKATVSSQRQQ